MSWKKALLAALLTWLSSHAHSISIDPKIDWFEKLKTDASPEQLYRFLYAMPKGGDLHNHLSGSNFSEWWWELATDPLKNGGYHYFTKVRIDACIGYGSNEFGFAPRLLLFRTVQESNFNKMSDCAKSQYKALGDLNEREKAAWLNSIRLDKAYEGRHEFFQTHWQRLNDLGNNPYIMAELLVKNMQAFGAEGLMYLETQENPTGKVDAKGDPIDANEVVDIFRQRLAEEDAKATGVTVRFQASVLRFIPPAEAMMEELYKLIDQNRDIYVALNMVGREDDDKGYPRRFLSTIRKLRRRIPQIPLAIHAGEVDEPNEHIRDTLLLGAHRIGHGINLITDPDTLLLMRNNDFMVEINLVSNLLLEYVSQYDQHPFPEYLRTGVPVALSTDDRGMWDSNMTDEFFVAVTEFNLSWDEVVKLSRNSLSHAFVDPDTKANLLQEFDKRLQEFVADFKDHGWNAVNDKDAISHGFTCRRSQICLD